MAQPSPTFHSNSTSSLDGSSARTDLDPKDAHKCYGCNRVVPSKEIYRYCRCYRNEYPHHRGVCFECSKWFNGKDMTILPFCDLGYHYLPRIPPKDIVDALLSAPRHKKKPKLLRDGN